jgi:hypothetical protein
MTISPECLLVVAVAAVGVLHTLVPDHWLPIAVMPRQLAWSRRRTACAALIAGLGHTVSTLAIGAVVWIAGVALAVRAGHFTSIASSVGLVGFGLWIAISSLREMRDGGADGVAGEPTVRQPKPQTALLLILGSSPMVEGIPAFFAAGRFGLACLQSWRQFLQSPRQRRTLRCASAPEQQCSEFVLGNWNNIGRLSVALL